MSLFIYGTATNTGKDFFTYQDRLDFYLSAHPGNVWVVGNNEKGAVWLANKNGITKTKSEAQAVVDAAITAAQEAWDASTDEEKLRIDRPTDITLPQEFIMSDYNVIAGLKIKYLSSDPSNPENGQVWYNSTTSKLRAGGILGTGAWSSGGNLNTGRVGNAGFGTQTAAVSAGGYSGTSSVEEYNGSSWTAVTSLPSGIDSAGSCGTQTQGLIFGGQTPGGPNVNTTLKYDGTNWTSVGTLNTTRRDLIGAGTQTSALAALGAIDPPFTTATEEYNGSSWTSVNSANGPARRSAAGGGTQTSALAFGGYGPTYTAATESYNGTNWTNVTSLPSARGVLGGGGTSNSDALAYGGYTGSYLATTNSWNGSSWAAENNLAVARGTKFGLPSGPTGAQLYAGGNPNPAGYAATEEFTVPVGTVNITSS